MNPVVGIPTDLIQCARGLASLLLEGDAKAIASPASRSQFRGIFPLTLSGCRSHAETVSDFRKNLSKSARPLKTSVNSPVTYPGSTQERQRQSGKRGRAGQRRLTKGSRAPLFGPVPDEPGDAHGDT